MATNHTSNYQLCQWEATDQVLRTDFNEDNAKVDAALKGLSTSVQQHSTQISQINQKVAALGNCQLYQSSYTGTGTVTSTLTFPHKPILIHITNSTAGHFFIAAQGASKVMALTGGDLDGFNQFTWNGKTVTWTNSRESASFQCNIKGDLYLVTALLDAAN